MNLDNGSAAATVVAGRAALVNVQERRYDHHRMHTPPHTEAEERRQRGLGRKVPRRRRGGEKGEDVRTAVGGTEERRNYSYDSHRDRRTDICASERGDVVSTVESY